MKEKYIQRLRQAHARRKTYLVPEQSNKLIFFAFLFAFAYILFSMIVHPGDETIDYHFYSERGLITALSGCLLAMSAAFAAGTLTVHIRHGSSQLWPWIIMMLGFVFLSLDETAQFHERLGDVMHESADSGIFRNWNDVIVILYGVVALPLVFPLLPSIIRYRKTLEFFIAAFLFYFIHTLVDSISEPSTTLSIIVEESAKLLCGIALALGMFFSFVGALWNLGANDKLSN